MKIQICKGKSCSAKFSKYIEERVIQDIQRLNLKNVIVETCGCQGKCKEGPVVVIDGNQEIYQNPIKTSEIIANKINKR